MKRFNLWNSNRDKNVLNRTKARRLSLENLEDRMLLAVMAGSEASADAALVAAPEPTGSVIEVTVLKTAYINEAISLAEDGDTIRFADSLKGKSFAFSRTLDPINKNITIDGNGVVFEGNVTSNGCAFNISNATVTIQNMTFTDMPEGAIVAEHTTLTLTDCVFTANHSGRLAGSDNTDIAGGAVSAYDATITIDGCSFTGNTGTGFAGAVGLYNEGGMYDNVLTVKNSSFLGNSSDGAGRGGAIAVVGGILKLSDSTLSENSVTGRAQQGGAVYIHETATAYIDDCVFSWNSASQGGAIFFNLNTVGKISNTLIVNNYADTVGGAVYSREGTSVDLRNCTVAFNSAKSDYGNIYVEGSANAYNTILANGFASKAETYNSNMTNLYNSVTTREYAINELDFASVYFADPATGVKYNAANWGAADWLALSWDYTITVASTAVNAGADEYALCADESGAIAADLAGNNRFVNRVDAGVYEVQNAGVTLAPPTNLVTSATETTITVTWDAVENAAGYSLRYQTEGSEWVNVDQITGTEYTITGLDSSTLYLVGVKAVSGSASYTDSPYTVCSAKTLLQYVDVEVTNLNDSGAGSLRAALESAQDGYRIFFSEGLGGGTLSIESALPEIGKIVSIDGGGITLTAASGYAGYGLSVNGGELTITNFTVSGFTAGGIVAENSVLILTNVVLSNNHSERTAGSDNLQIAGGGISAHNSNVTLTGCTVSGNTGTGYGGGIVVYNEAGNEGNVLTIQDSMISGNSSDLIGRGGGISVIGGTLRLSDSTVTGNAVNGDATIVYARQGGGLYVHTGSIAFIDNCVFSWNYSNGDGGAMNFFTYSYGFISNTLIVNNCAAEWCGAFYTYGGAEAHLRNCTVAFNVAGMVYGNIRTASNIYNTILTNGFSSDPAKLNSEVIGSYNSFISRDNMANEAGFANVYFTDPADGKAYGYGTWADASWRSLNWDFSLTKRSALRNAGNDAYALCADTTAPIAADITGGSRFVESVDMGAYEFQTIPKLLDSPANLSGVAAETEIAVSWDAVENASGYTLRYRVDVESATWTEVTGIAETGYTITGLDSFTVYTIEVKAVDATGEYDESDYVSCTVRTLAPVTEILVTNLNDSGEGSFRAALEAAQFGYNIKFIDSLIGGTLTIESALPEITNVISVEGNGVTLTAASGYTGYGLSVNGGDATITNFTVSGFATGGIVVENSVLILTNVVLSNNHSERTVGNDPLQIAGGGISAHNSNVTLTGCTVSGNTGTGYGGGIVVYNEAGNEGNVLTIQDSMISGNSSDLIGRGGGISVIGGTLRLSDSTVTGNAVNGDATIVYARQGGGLYVHTGSTAFIDDCVFSWNYSNGDGGAMNFFISSYGFISNTLIVNNCAAEWCGAFYTYGGAEAHLRNCTVAFNVAGMVYGNIRTASNIYNTILTNGFSSDPAKLNSEVIGSYNSFISSDNMANEAGFANVYFTDPADGKAYGYGTWADASWRSLDWDFSLTTESPGYNTGNDAYALCADTTAPIAADINGGSRFVGPVDMGAYELQVAPTEPLAAPVNVSVISAGANRKTVSWDAVENAVSYTVAYSADQVNWTEIAASETFVTVTGLTYGTQVSFKVKALGDGSSYSDSDYSESVAKYVCPMDIDSDGRIGPADRSALSAAWFTRSSSAAWDVRADIDGDGFVGPVDRNFLSLNWMKSATSTSLTYPEAKADAVFDEIAEEEIDFSAPSLDVDFDLF